MAKVWCYVLDAAGVEAVTSVDGSEVGTVLKKHIYQCEDNNRDLADDGTEKLYHAANDKIDPSDLYNALKEYYDLVPPVITILGQVVVNLIVGEVYTDAGATAFDEVDGDITANIVTVDGVDNLTVGSYTVTYNVTDSAGNPAVEVVRNVIVSAA